MNTSETAAAVLDSRKVILTEAIRAEVGYQYEFDGYYLNIYDVKSGQELWSHLNKLNDTRMSLEEIRATLESHGAYLTPDAYKALVFAHKISHENPLSDDKKPGWCLKKHV